MQISNRAHIPTYPHEPQEAASTQTHAHNTDTDTKIDTDDTKIDTDDIYIHMGWLRLVGSSKL